MSSAQPLAAPQSLRGTPAGGRSQHFETPAEVVHPQWLAHGFDEEDASRSGCLRRTREDEQDCTAREQGDEQGAGHSLPASVEDIEASVQGRSGEEDAKLQREEDGVTVVATRDEEEDENDLSSCTICLEVLRPGQLSTTLPCRHAFHQDCIMRWLGTKVYKQQAGCCPTCNFRVIAPAVLPPPADQPQTRSDPALRGAEHEPESPGLALPPPISEPISSEIAPWARYTMLLAAGFAFFLFVTIAIVKAVMD